LLSVGGFDMPRSLLVLGAGSDQLFMIRTAHQMGFETVAVDANPSAPGLAIATHSNSIDFSNLSQVITYVEDLKAQGVNVSGVSTMGSDIPHLVSAAASHFGWVGPSWESAMLATHKLKMKEQFRRSGIPVPKFAQVENASNILERWDEWGCSSLVVKPTDRAGSRGVRVILDPDQVEDVFNYALSFSRNGQVMVEEFVEGEQFSTESILLGGRGITPGFAERVYEGMDSFLPNIMENGGWIPCELNSGVYRSICDLVERAAAAIGIDRGPAKGDVVLCPKRGPIIIEMAARLSGGDFCESLVPLGTGVNYVETTIDIAMGENPDLDLLKPTRDMTVANRYFFPPPGRLEEIKGVQECRSLENVVKLELYYEPGDQIPVMTNHAQRAGVFIVIAQSRDCAKKIIDNVYSKITFVIDGQEETGRPESYRFSN
jgi:biotin carboxylase